MATVRRFAFALLLSWPLALASCGGGSATTLPPGDGGGGPVPPPAPDGETLFIDFDCAECHGVAANGATAPSVRCTSADALDAYVRRSDTPHTGGARTRIDDEQLAAIATFLGRGCAMHVPPSHTVDRGGFLHRPGTDVPGSCAPCHGQAGEGYGSVPDCVSCHAGQGGPPSSHTDLRGGFLHNPAPDAPASCAPCHGTAGEGSDLAPSCASCHDAGGGGAIGCTGCHLVARDDGDGVPPGGRRPVVGELGLLSHHVGAGVTDADCQVCHEMSEHRGGRVRLRNVDDPTVVTVLLGSPLVYAVEAERLEGFCLACHDADAAGGAAPFSTGGWPAAVDAGTWQGASHHVAAVTCLGDGVTFGCHANGHGADKRSLLARYDLVSPGPAADPAREEEAFCLACHRAGGVATSDVALEFAQSSHHRVASTEQGDGTSLECTHCHDPHQASTTVPLRDPDQGGPWTGTMQGFCLACHDGAPPTGVAFPTTSLGTGWDKSAFAGTRHAVVLGGDACADCHGAHGTPNPALLLGSYALGASHTLTSGSYGACFACHDATDTLYRTNAFAQRHDKHVVDERVPCAVCHDVHGPYDAGEPGLVSFLLAVRRGWGPVLPTGTTQSSAFYLSSDGATGFCAITCHGERHDPFSYARSAGN